MNARVLISLSMMVLWIGVFAYFLVKYEHFRDPFGGEPMVLLLYLLLVLSLVWNGTRAYFSWKPSQPPVRRSDDS
jgi:hypothetical protein